MHIIVILFLVKGERERDWKRNSYCSTYSQEGWYGWSWQLKQRRELHCKERKEGKKKKMSFSFVCSLSCFLAHLVELSSSSLSFLSLCFDRKISSLTVCVCVYVVCKKERERKEKVRWIWNEVLRSLCIFDNKNILIVKGGESCWRRTWGKWKRVKRVCGGGGSGSCGVSLRLLLDSSFKGETLTEEDYIVVSCLCGCGISALIHCQHCFFHLSGQYFCIFIPLSCIVIFSGFEFAFNNYMSILWRKSQVSYRGGVHFIWSRNW